MGVSLHWWIPNARIPLVGRFPGWVDPGWVCPYLWGILGCRGGVIGQVDPKSLDSWVGGSWLGGGVTWVGGWIPSECVHEWVDPWLWERGFLV